MVVAGEGDDLLLGRGGDDVLCGGEGEDRLHGGAGDDVVDGGEDSLVTIDTDAYEWYGDVLAGGPGDDALVSGPTEDHPSVDALTFARATRGVRLDLAAGTATGDGSDTVSGAFSRVTGSDFDDVLRGSDRPEDIAGGAGSDQVVGRGGNDSLLAADFDNRLLRSSDVLLGGAGRDELQGSNGEDVLRGGPGNDIFSAGGGADRSYGGGGNDEMGDVVVAGEDQLVAGGPGARDNLSELFFKVGGDFVRNVDGRIDLAREGVEVLVRDTRITVPVTGFENVAAPSGRWVLLGTDGPNDLVGDWRQPANLRGRGGDDDLVGSRNDDVLRGGPGRDTGLGYTGSDRYVSVEKIRR